MKRIGTLFLILFIFSGEIRLASFVAEHNLPFRIMEHLPKLIQSVCPDSKIAEEIKCSTTKTHAIIDHIIGKESFDNLCEDLRQTKFSLIIDESTDLSTTKHLCLVVRYAKKNRIWDCFLALVPLEAANAVSLFEHIVNVFNSNNIPYKKHLIGFASDGANVMMGRNNSVVTLLQNEIPDIFILKCTCHSFHLCASYACTKLPRFIEDFVRDIYNYFSSSPKRVSEFKNFQIFCDLKVHKIIHPSQTRWLSVHAAVKRILDQFSALKLFFIDQVSNNDHLLAAENILQKLHDPTTLLFLEFLDFVLPLFNDLNKEMQAEHPKIHILYEKVSQTLRTFFDCFLKREYLTSNPIENVDFNNPRNFMDIDVVYYGAAATDRLLSSSDLSPSQVNLFKCRCLAFYVEACQQIITRFPLKNNPIKGLGVIEPTNVKSGKTASIIPVVRLFPNIVQNNDFQQIDTEWRILRNCEQIKTFPDNIELFWDNVSLLKRGDDTQMVPLLSAVIYTILSLPHSSANVERIFSHINRMKTKQRNRLSTESITGLLHTKRQLNEANCYDFEISSNMTEAMAKEYWYDPKDRKK